MKTYIWALPTRIFHWLLAISFTVAYVLGDSEELRHPHFAFGAFVGTLVFFRLLYGLFGPKYSHFRDFPMGFRSQKEFVTTFFSNTKAYAGHNPLASIVMLTIFIVGLLCSISGFLMYATENGIVSLNVDEDFLGESHEILANLFLLLVIFHVLGIIADTVFHGKTGTLASIFSGYKSIEAENVKLTGFQKFFTLLWFIVPFILFYLALGLKTNEKGDGYDEEYKYEQNESEEHEDDEHEEDDGD